MSVRPLLLVGAGMATIYGAAFILRQITLAKSSEFKVLNVRKNDLSIYGVHLQITASIKNNSNLKCDILGQNYDLLVNKMPIGTIKSSDQFSLEPGKAQTFTLDAFIDFKKTLSAGKSLDWKDFMENVVTIKGKVTAKTFNVLISKIPVSTDIRIREFLS